jgi:uncharacterized protein DUF1707
MTAPAHLRTLPTRSTSSARAGSAAPDTTTEARTAPRLRASNEQRMATVDRLHEAVGLGLLTLEEGDERVLAALEARYADELPPLTADLPPAPAKAPVAPGWRAVASVTALQARTSLLGASSWAAAHPSRRRAVAVAGILLAVLFIVILTASVASGSGGVGDDGYWDHYQGYGHHHWRD